MDLAERLLARVGRKPEDFKANSKIGGMFREHGVRASSEFDRIIALPTREWDGSIAHDLTRFLRKPGGRQTLRPHQAAALQEAHDYRGCVIAAAVGTGKTLISFLLPVVLEAKRPLLIIPKKLEKKTRREFAILAQHWRGDIPTIISYEKLARINQAEYLENLNPDLIIADEAHKLKNTRAGVTKRIRRWRKAHPDVPFIPMTGTITRKSLLEYAHLSEWALKANSPVPRHWAEAESWHRALGEVQDGDRLALGALEYFGATLDSAREGYAHRRAITPGWISVTGSGVESGLDCDVLEVLGDVENQVADLRGLWETPDGIAIEDPRRLAALIRQISLGFWYRYDPPPPKPWLDARREWARLCRDILAHNKLRLDTPMQVAQAIVQGKVLDYGIYDKWERIRPTYDMDKHRKTEWLDFSVVQAAVEWAEENQGLVATPWVAFGEMFKATSGMPYFGQQGLDPECGDIDEWEGPACISTAANKEGRNLQRYSKLLVVSGGPNAAELEQLIGRLHRSGQTADTVEVTFLVTCPEDAEAIDRARAEAKAADHPEHKLLIATWA